MSAWQEYTVQEIALHMADAPFGSNIKNDDYTNDGAVVVQGKNIQGRNCVWNDVRYVSNEKYLSLKRHHASLEALVFPKVGTIGKVGILTKHGDRENYLLSTNTMMLIPDPSKADIRYVYYFFSSNEVKSHINAISSNSVQPVFNFTSLKNYNIPIPQLETQKAIASVLSSLDDKIDLLHRQNTTLERMAETLFRQWFVEEAQEDWEDYKVSDFAEHLKQGVNPAQNPFEEYHHYSLPAFDEGQRPVIELGSEILSNKYRVLGNTILVSKLNPRFPRIWAIQNVPSTNSVCSTEFQVFKPKQDNLYAYLYFLFGSSHARDALEMAASGTSGSHQRVRPEDMLYITTQLPSIGKAIEFSEITQTNIDKITANRKQIQTLEKLRDNLLPKLMSGEVRVS